MSLAASARTGMTADFPSLCQPGEFALLNARMGQFDQDDTLKQTGKLLSLCADRPQEPFGRFVYRFGRVGEVEMEQVATPAGKFGVYSHFVGHNAGENIVYFSKGPFSYYVFESIGMGSGITLAAVKSGKRIAYFFSGTDADKDFQSKLDEIDFGEARSPVFVERAPRVDLDQLLAQ